MFYAVNGMGVGHVTRLLTIAKELRALAHARGKSVLIMFVTSSEGDQRLYENGFPTFKVPSEMAIPAALAVSIGYVSVAAKCVLSILDSVGPHLVVVDGYPAGSFGELLPTRTFNIRDICNHLVCIYRPVREQVAQRPGYIAMLELYDRLIIPTAKEHSEQSIASGLISVPTHYVGPIYDIFDWTGTSKEDIRKQLKLDPDKYTIYVSTGGGGHSDAERQITEICKVISAMDRAQAIVAHGPLFRGKRAGGPNIHQRDENAGMRLMAASDVAISAAGSNSFNELMHLRIPTVFVPLATKSDDQVSRANTAERGGAAVVLTLEQVLDRLPSILESWRDPSTRQTLANKAATFGAWQE